MILFQIRQKSDKVVFDNIYKVFAFVISLHCHRFNILHKHYGVVVFNCKG